jgi:hypothetical protein
MVFLCRIQSEQLDSLANAVLVLKVKLPFARDIDRTSRQVS